MNTDITVPEKTVGAKRQKLRRWWLRLTLASLIIGPLIFAVAAIGYKMGMMDLGTSFGLNRGIGPKFLIVSVIIGAIALVLALAIKPRKGLLIGTLGLLIPLLGLAKLNGVKQMAGSLPVIHDITTDTQDVPGFTDAILSERAKTEGVNTTDYAGKVDIRQKKLVSALQSQAYPDIRPLILTEDPKIVFGRAESVAKSMGWEIASADAASGLIEATDTTFWYGFKDDVVIRIRPSEGGGTVLDVRSVSRVGQSDLGKNAARIKAFLDKMSAG